MCFASYKGPRGIHTVGNGAHQTTCQYHTDQLPSMPRRLAFEEEDEEESDSEIELELSDSESEDETAPADPIRTPFRPLSSTSDSISRRQVWAARRRRYIDARRRRDLEGVGHRSTPLVGGHHYYRHYHHHHHHSVHPPPAAPPPPTNQVSRLPISDTIMPRSPAPSPEVLRWWSPSPTPAINPEEIQLES